MGRLPKFHVVMVFTGHSLEKMRQHGGVGHWRANLDRVTRMKYVVCVRNTNQKYAADDHPHGTAFFVGHISGAVSVGDRVLIEVDKYVNIDVPDVWDGSTNPVRYLTLAEAQIQLGDFEALRWHPFGREEVLSASDILAEAKRSLSAKLKVPTEDIQIIVRH
jgi:hypothetical protein